MYAYRNKLVRCFASAIDSFGSLFFKENNKALEEVNSILVIKLDHLGDCFIVTPLFEQLRKRFPTAKLDVLCRNSCEPIFRNDPNINSIVCFNYWRSNREKKSDGFWKLINLAKEKRKQYDLVIDARGEPGAALLSFLLNAKYRVGFKDEEIGSFFYTKKIAWSREEEEWKKYGHLLEFFGVSVNIWNPKIFLSDEENKKISQLLPVNNFVVAGIGAGAEYKKYPIKNYIAILKTIKETKNIDIVLLGSDEDSRDAKTVVSSIVDRLHDYTGKYTIRIAYGILRSAKGFIGNDSVLAHFSGSFDIPTIELMSGINNEKRWRAIGKNVRVFVGFSSSHNCSIKACVSCPHMLSISSDDVVRSVLEMI